MIVTYKYYDGKKRRLGIMAEALGEVIKVTEVACSGKDSFARKDARQALEAIAAGKEAFIGKDKVHPIFYEIPYVGLKGWTGAFFAWAEENLYRRVERRKTIVRPVLIRPESKILNL